MNEQVQHCTSEEIIVKVQRIAEGSNGYEVIGSSICSDDNENEGGHHKIDTDNAVDEVIEESSIASPAPSIIGSQQKGAYFLRPNDRSTLSDYMFILIGQFKLGSASEKDISKARRKAPNVSIGYSGLKCKHCGGCGRGSYFPSSQKNLQACPTMFHKHLMKCELCSSEIKNALQASKSKHRSQQTEKKVGTQVGFFTTFWKRIRGELENDGETDEGKDIVSLYLRHLIKKYTKEKTCKQFMDNTEEKHSSRNSLTEEGDSSSSQEQIRENHSFQATNQSCPSETSPSPSIATFATPRSKDPLKVLDDVIDLVLMNDRIMCNNPINPGISSNINGIDWDQQSIAKLQLLTDSDPDMMEMIDLLLDP